MPGHDQSRDQVRSYMSGTTNDDDTHDFSFFVIIRLDWEELKKSRIQEFEKSRIQEEPEAGSKNWAALDYALLSPELLQLLTPRVLEFLSS
jgi:hypothetical protein